MASYLIILFIKMYLLRKNVTLACGAIPNIGGIWLLWNPRKPPSFAHIILNAGIIRCVFSFQLELFHLEG